MLREIRKKMVILRNRSPFPKEVREYLQNLEYREWIHMNMHLCGSALSPEQIDIVLQGGCLMEAAVSDYLMIDRLEELRQFIYRLTDLGAPLSENIIRDMQAILTGKNQRPEYRKSTPVLQQYGRMAMLADQVPDAMAQLVRFAGPGARAASIYNPLELAAVIHDRLLEIYPFLEGNETLALAVLYYMVAEAGLPLAALKVDREVYDQLYRHYLSERNSRGLAKLLEQAVLERLELMTQLTGHDI